MLFLHIDDWISELLLVRENHVTGDHVLQMKTGTFPWVPTCSCSATLEACAATWGLHHRPQRRTIAAFRQPSHHGWHRLCHVPPLGAESAGGTSHRGLTKQKASLLKEDPSRTVGLWGCYGVLAWQLDLCRNSSGETHPQVLTNFLHIFWSRFTPSIPPWSIWSPLISYSDGLSGQMGFDLGR